MIAIKGTKKGDKGSILDLEGTGASPKWSIRWSDGQICSHNAKSLQIYENELISESNFDSDEESEADSVIESDSDSDSDSESIFISYSNDCDEGISAQL